MTKPYKIVSKLAKPGKRPIIYIGATLIKGIFAVFGGA
jgi:hypothetical protein